MKLFIVRKTSGWSTEHYAVHASSDTHAIELTSLQGENTEAIEIDPEGPPAVLWEFEYCPDSR